VVEESLAELLSGIHTIGKDGHGISPPPVVSLRPAFDCVNGSFAAHDTGTRGSAVRAQRSAEWPGACRVQ
jgi:hypothetical protein